MQFYYNTRRLRLFVPDAESAEKVLRFYSTNRAFFDPWTPPRERLFYTLEYQRTYLDASRKLFVKSKGIRYYITEAEAPDLIVGTVSLSDINPVYASCQLGYQIAQSHCRRGYASEALAFLIPLAFGDLKLARIEANVMPDNIASIRLLEKTGFVYEGTSRGYATIGGRLSDHARYSLIEGDLTGSIDHADIKDIS